MTHWIRRLVTRAAASPAGPEVESFDQFLEKHEVTQGAADEVIAQEKLRLLSEIGEAESIRDYGGIWEVRGRYLLEGIKALGATRAHMIDTLEDEEFTRRVEELQAERPVRVEVTHADFRDHSLQKHLEPVDVSLLYDVILHQDDACGVIRDVLQRTRRYVCLAQPVLREEMFRLPNGCVNLQFYPRELKDRLQVFGWGPQERPRDRFCTGSWIWGQTVSYLTSVCYGYGWDRDHLKVLGFSRHWNYALMRFTPRGPSEAEEQPAR